MKLPLKPMYPVHLALMKSSLAALHGPRIHNHLRRNPPNALIEILVKSLEEYNPANSGFYLSLIKQSGEPSITMDLRRKAARLIATALSELPARDRKEEWVGRAIGWVCKLDSEFALPFLARVRDERKFFFFRAWPADCRHVAEQNLASVDTPDDEKSGG